MIFKITPYNHNTRRPTCRLAPFGERHNEGNDGLHARCCQGLMAVAIGEQYAAVFERLGAERGNPKITICLVDVGRDHAARTEIKAELNGNQHDREQNSDQRHGQSNTIVDEIAQSER